MIMRVLIVDDSLIFQHLIREALKEIPEVEVVGVASNGKLAITGIRSLKPDLILLDLEMPELDGLGVLREIREKKLSVGAIVLSAATTHGSAKTQNALELGAFHFVPKPSEVEPHLNIAAIRSSVAPLILAYARARALKAELQVRPPSSESPEGTRSDPEPLPRVMADARSRNSQSGPSRTNAKRRPDLLLIGASTGGPDALTRMLPQLQPGLGVSILIVQHMPPIFTKGLADSLAAKCAIGVKEAQDGDVLKPDFAYIAPGGRQMMVIPASNGRKVIRITDDPPENSCKPSVDYLFRSVARYFPGKTLVLIMTGMGNDGTSGLRLLKPQGAITVAQDEASCVVFGMPREAIQAGVIDYVFPLDRLALELTRLLQGAGL